MRRLGVLFTALMTVLSLGLLTLAPTASAGRSPYQVTIKIARSTCEIQGTLSWTTPPEGATYFSVAISRDGDDQWAGGSGDVVSATTTTTQSGIADPDGLTHTYYVKAGFGTSYWDYSLGTYESRTVKFRCR